VHEGASGPERCPVCGVGRELFEPQAVQATPSAGAAQDLRLLILGGGIAGLTAAERAREAAPGVEIILVDKEPGAPYFRLNLTRLLAGEVQEQALALKPEGWYRDKRIELLQGEAVALDPQLRRVTLSDERRLSYDRLILANGSHPFVPPIAGARGPGVLSFRTRADARAIQALAPRGARCVCIGGGLLGLETAGALASQGVRVSLLEGSAALLPRQLAPRGAQLLQEHLEGLGVKILTGVRANAIEQAAGERLLRLTDGSELRADLVVLSTGVRPNSFLARLAGLSVATGVVVDDGMRTSNPDILAAGDVAEHRGRLYSIWPAAWAQGEVAGINAVGGEASFAGIPPSAQLKVVGIGVFSAGQFLAPDASYWVMERERDGSYARLVLRDGHLVGANLVGDAALAMPILEAIRQKTPVVELDFMPGMVA